MLNTTTRLDALNTILSIIGEEPVNSLPSSSEPASSETASALRILDEVIREVQTEGWSFNIEDMTLSAAGDGYIYAPANAAIIAPDHKRDSRQFMVRDGKLYDLQSQTFNMTSPVFVTVSWLFSFENLPEPARRYVTIRAARIAQGRLVGSGDLHMFSEDEERRARAALARYDANHAGLNVLDNSWFNRTHITTR